MAENRRSDGVEVTIASYEVVSTRYVLSCPCGFPFATCGSEKEAERRREQHLGTYHSAPAGCVRP